MMKQAAWTIQELTRRIKMNLEQDKQLQNVWVQAEISNFKHHSSGHMYFTLKDRSSRIRAVMFASRNARLGFIPEAGMRVLARGNVSVYERDGQYQFYVQEMQPDGIGNLYLAYEELKKKLEAEGLFAADRKRPIPAFPRSIGVLTSPTGAAVRDVLTTLRRRSPFIPVLFSPVSVQGRDAAPSIVKALTQMNRLNAVDVIIVGRGGGSLEELWAFNEESVARAIANSSIPVISAVGHETDYTIADFVSDLRAATPTAAAELAAPNRLELRQRLQASRKRLEQSLFHQVQEYRNRLKRLQGSAALLRPDKLLHEPAERLDRLNSRLRYAMQVRTQRSKEAVSRLQRSLWSRHPRRDVELAVRRREETARRLIQATSTVIERQRLRWRSNVRQLDALSPLRIMERGYSVTYDEQKQTIIRSVGQVQPGDLVKVTLRDGELDCQVWGMKGETES